MSFFFICSVWCYPSPFLINYYSIMLYSFLMHLSFSLIWRIHSNTLCKLNDLVMNCFILLLSWIDFLCHSDRKVSVIVVVKFDNCHFKPFCILKFLLKEQLLLWYAHLYDDSFLWLPISLPWSIILYFNCNVVWVDSFLALSILSSECLLCLDRYLFS